LLSFQAANAVPGGQANDQTRHIPMTFYTYPQPVLNPQLEQV
jgi:hypothetical protein